MTIYVNMTDRFMSGWGRAANGHSYLCIKCETLDQAEAIARAACDRNEMKRIDLSERPRRSAGSHTSIKTFDELGDVWKKYYRQPVEA